MLEKLKTTMIAVALVGMSTLLLAGCTGPSASDFANTVVDQSSTTSVQTPFDFLDEDTMRLEYSVMSATFDFFPEEYDGDVLDPKAEDAEYIKVEAEITNVSDEIVAVEEYDFKMYAGLEELFPTGELRKMSDTMSNQFNLDIGSAYELQPGETINASFYYMPVTEGAFGAETFKFATVYEGQEGIKLVTPAE